MMIGPSCFGFISPMYRVFMFLESSHTLSPFLNGIKVDFHRSAMRVVASSCAASASSRFLIKVFILSSTAGYFMFSNESERVIGDSPNMSLKGVFIRSACCRLLCVNSIRCKAFGQSSG